MAGISLPKTSTSQPNIPLEQLAKNIENLMAKNMHDMMAQINALREEQNAQMGEIRIRLEDIELSYQDDNRKHLGRHKRNEQALEIDGESDNG